MHRSLRRDRHAVCPGAASLSQGGQPGGRAAGGLPERCFDHLSNTEAATADQLARLEQGVDLRVDGSHGEAPQPWLLTGSNTAVQLQMQAPLAHAVVWSDPPRPMVCLEPWSARRGEWGRKLLPGEHCELRCRYVIRPV